MKQLLLLATAVILFGTQALDAKTQSSLKTKIESDLKKHNDTHLGKLLKENVNTNITLDQLEALAKKNRSLPLLNAVKHTRKAKAKAKRFNITSRELLQLSYFIETTLSKHIAGETFYLQKHKTGLSQILEHDPRTNTSFIVLEGKKAALGEGKKKTVNYALMYDPAHPKVVARAEQTEEMRREMEITKKMQGKPGLFETVGFAKHKKNGKSYKTIYSKIYSPGSLQTAFEKKCKLSLHEKMTAALNILRGLESLHTNKIVHRDLGARNYLINIPHGKPGRRNVEACIADLGRADYVKSASVTKIQGNTKYTSPEGLFIKKFKRNDYYSADVFAVGCVFYRLFYEKMAPWQDKSYVKDTHRSLKSRYKKMSHRIKKATKARRTKLAGKSSSRLTKKEAFELLILRMLHTNPSKRGSAEDLRRELELICR